MTDTGGRIKVEVLHLMPSDVARGAKELVAFEREAQASWDAATTADRSVVRSLIRGVLLRLMGTSDWMPGSVRIGAGRLDVRLTVELHDVDGTLVDVRRVTRLEHQRVRRDLRALIAELEAGDAAGS